MHPYRKGINDAPTIADRNGSNQILNIFFSEIPSRKESNLSKNEEERLLTRGKCGDRAAFNKLITHNLRFGASVARKFQ
jgi:DNA-directed RNA polymerase sigma subunit (sigma70/sigma32)